MPALLPLTETTFAVQPLIIREAKVVLTRIDAVIANSAVSTQYIHMYYSLIPCCYVQKIGTCKIPQSPCPCYLWKVVPLWRELNLKSRFLNYSGVYANKPCYESNLKILILSIGVCLRLRQPYICNKLAFKQNCIHFEKSR